MRPNTATPPSATPEDRNRRRSSIAAPPGGTIGIEQPDSDGACLDGAFVPEDVHVVTTGIDKPRLLCVHSGLAVGIVSFIVRED